jgi:hypothetical protein
MKTPLQRKKIPYYFCCSKFFLTRIPKMKILALPLLVRMATLWEWANMLFGYLYVALGGTPEPQTASRQGLLVESAVPRSHAARRTWCTTSWNHGGGWWELARWIGSAFEKILGHLRLKSSAISPIRWCVRTSSSFLRWPQILHWWASRSARVTCGKCASLPDEGMTPRVLIIGIPATAQEQDEHSKPKKTKTN